MRTIALALISLLVAGLAVVAPGGAPAARAVVGGPKVVIVVGAVEGQTSNYRSHGDAVAAEASKYTPNVVKVYSPNATWAAVKNAAIGANVLIYLGHGNGWPSPYTYDPNYTTKDGFGLNKTAGAGDSNRQYYGEPYIETLDLAPNALVLLFHLCYAAGNSEPGNPEPTPSVAKQRADNYASAFLRAGAGAVIADGHRHSGYLDALFTTSQTLEQLWRGMPNFNNHVITNPSSRTAGATVLQDPDTATTSYYRSLTGNRSLMTGQVTGGAATDVDPATLQVPGAASVAADGTPLYPDPAAITGDLLADTATTLDAGTRLRVTDEAGPAPDGSPIVEVSDLGGGALGWMVGSTLVPRDSAAPRPLMVDDGGAFFSPNADGVKDTYSLRIAISESATWTLRILAGDAPVVTESGSGTSAAATWDGKIDGTTAPDGTYTWELAAGDAWANTGTSTGSFRLDATSLMIESVFTDLGSQFLPDIQWLYLEGITGGCGGSRFCPRDPVTRAQMAMFLTRALNLPSTDVDYFADDNGKTGEWAINRLAASGITGGCGGSRFCPTGTVTRVQMALFLARALNLPSTDVDYFADDNGMMGEWAINRLAAAGITGGCGTGRYCPGSNVTRGQMAAFLHRALGGG